MWIWQKLFYKTYPKNKIKIGEKSYTFVIQKQKRGTNVRRLLDLHITFKNEIKIKTKSFKSIVMDHMLKIAIIVLTLKLKRKRLL